MKTWISLFLLFVIGACPSFAQVGSQLTEFGESSHQTTLIDKSKRYVNVLAGLALLEEQPGYHIELATGYQPGTFGIGAFTSFARVPDYDFSNWTIMGLQLRAGPQSEGVRPYGVFDYGMINMVVIGDDVNMRTATLDLGGGVEFPGSKSRWLADFRWKRFLDYKGERDAYTVWTINVGMRF